MILLVAAGDSGAACRRAIEDATIVSAATVPAARETLADAAPSVIVLDFTSIDGAADLLSDVRGGEFGDPAVPVVLLLDDEDPDPLPTLAIDELLYRPFRPADLEDAVARAREVSDYREAVTALYEQSRERAEGDCGDGAPFAMSSDLRAARREADERLAALMDRPGVLSSLLWTARDREIEE